MECSGEERVVKWSGNGSEGGEEEWDGEEGVIEVVGEWECRRGSGV